jgi:hypothetical protein
MSLNSSRHRIELGAGPGIRLRKAFGEQATVTKIETDISSPSLLSFEDLASGQIDSTVTPGNIGVINGHRLKFDPIQGDEGVYFINTADGPSTKSLISRKTSPASRSF